MLLHPRLTICRIHPHAGGVLSGKLASSLSRLWCALSLRPTVCVPARPVVSAVGFRATCDWPLDSSCLLLLQDMRIFANDGASVSHGDRPEMPAEDDLPAYFGCLVQTVGTTVGRIDHFEIMRPIVNTPHCKLRHWCAGDPEGLHPQQ